LANTYIAAQEYKEAVKLLKNQVDISRDDSTRRRCNIGMAVALYKDGNKDEAEKLFDLLSEAEPDDPSIALTQTSLLGEDRQWSVVLAKVTNWYERHPDDIRTGISIAENLMKMTDKSPAALKTAEDILRMILDKTPNQTEAMRALAILLQAAQRDSEAAEIYQRILEIKPDDLIAINNLAWILCENQKKFRQALELAQKGLKIAPQYIDLIDTRGVAYYRLGEFNKAIKDFTTCLDLYPIIAPSLVASHFHLARALAECGEKNKATEYLTRALELESRLGGLSTVDLAEARDLLKTLPKVN
jgi:tetratricopeptide (TPR) repeat protein